jgi:hypothetical protein
MAMRHPSRRNPAKGRNNARSAHLAVSAVSAAVAGNAVNAVAIGPRATQPPMQKRLI